ncbi:hypothetical protein M0R45_000172 [Rubus argutus]|uniref:Bifunctional inhibitor/plant lipid transfer protein/seed storage helical domain-containing protein n=1 Tax=Rubus argutus TaxID=59490 RepID=A0AAW1VPZ1_RUBAR
MGSLFSYVMIIVLICGSAKGQASNFCAQTWNEFSNCMRFITGLFSQPSAQCCDSVRRLNMMAKSNENGPRNICQCIEDMSRTYGIPFVASIIQDLPIKCNAHLSFPISNSMNCTTM